jgi:hypothetical protein
MIRLVPIIIMMSLLVAPVLSGDAEVNSTDEYIVQELIFFEFDDAYTPDSNNTTLEQGEVQVAGNATRPGGEMTARKLFQLKQAAREDYQKLADMSVSSVPGLSPTSSQGVSIICKQCIPIPVEEI